MTRLLLLRHGESVAQVDGVIGGPKGCTGLSDLGRQQVALLADRWRRIGPRADVDFVARVSRAITEWSHGEHPWAPAGGWRLERFNDHAHLE